MCNRAKIVEGIVIGIGGGAGAGLVICGISYLREKWLESRHKKRIYKWLEKGIKSELPICDFRSSYIIARYTNLTKDRVCYICAIHPNIRERLGKDSEDTWNIITEKEIKN